MTLENSLIDTRFQYSLDNPFPEDVMGDKKRKLKKYIAMHADEFTEIDYLVDNRFMILFPETAELFGTEVNGSDLSNTEFNNALKKIIAEAPCASDELKNWGQRLDKIKVPIPTVEVVQTGGASGNTQKQVGSTTTSIVSTNPVYIPSTNIQSQLNISKIIGSGTLYDMYSEKQVTWDELGQITVNIARVMLNPKQKQDTTLLELENEERRQLINAIQEFKNVTVISPYIEDDLGKMTIEQLKTLREKCEKLHAQFKINEVLKSGFNVCSMAYDTLFPEGIPISKTKRLQFGGIGEELKNKLLDNTKTIGFGFSRFLQKYDINVTDEITILVAIGEVLASKAKVVTKKKKEKKDGDSADDDNDDNESSESSDDESSDSESSNDDELPALADV